MAIYEIRNDRLEAVPPTTFAASGVRERADLQRFLRDNVDAIAPGTLVIAEEFGEWEGSNRRIDLLAVDREANLVVIELKRTEDGGHMELQAVRYAAMVSTLTFARAVDVFAAYLESRGDRRDAEATLLEFLGWESGDDGDFAPDVRIVLASAEFSKEITSSVLWLAAHQIDVRCVRIRPYGDADRVLLDVQQIIPLPEAEEFQVRIREKQSEDRSSRRSRKASKRFRVSAEGQLFTDLPRNHAVLRVVSELCQRGVTPDEIATAIPWRKKLFLAADGELNSKDFESAVSVSSPIGVVVGNWFRADGELIHSQGKTYAFSWSWGGRAEEAMRNLVEQLGKGKIAVEAEP